ncbi:MAG: carboxypeptidase-like regulatory domain-containing protein [Saprospiraceae bacterium]
MKYICYTLLFCCIQLFSFGQITIKGKILNKKNKEPIPYVNIGIPKHAQGTVSDEDGNYFLKFNDSNDTVIISAIGFFSQNKSVNELLQNGEILLEQQIHQIKEINLIATEFDKEKLFGKKNKNRGLSVGFGNAQLGCKIGSSIKIKKETYLKSANFKLNHADGDSLLFRVNIYHFEKGKIGENILKENITIYAPQKRGILTVDLTPYELIINHDVLLTLEWIKDDNGSGNHGITFDTKKGRKSNIWNKRTSQNPFKINKTYGRRGMGKKSLCFWLIGKEVK